MQKSDIAVGDLSPYGYVIASRSNATAWQSPYRLGRAVGDLSPYGYVIASRSNATAWQSPYRLSRLSFRLPETLFKKKTLSGCLKAFITQTLHHNTHQFFRH
ncbi:MAG: hypothetical protein J6U05_07290, partial [Neisseriaceae bacterium]|nr:hypothetical protein [Neisseriaceae bacterium]